MWFLENQFAGYLALIGKTANRGRRLAPMQECTLKSV
jgi:hypothetical protein